MGLMDIISEPLGLKNKFQAAGAPMINPFGSDQAATQQIQGAQATSAGLLGKQGTLADTLAGRMQTSDPRYASLYSLLGDVAAGRGPNPAQEQFKQNINQAVQQQAGTVASVRGLNPALAARLAATGGAGMMQGAAGQAATLQAGQQLGALGQMGGLLGQETGLQAQYGGLAAGALGQAGAQGLTQQQILQAAAANANAQRVQQQASLNQVNAGVAAQNTGTNASLFGGILQGVGGALALPGMARGGVAGSTPIKPARIPEPESEPFAQPYDLGKLQPPEVPQDTTPLPGPAPSAVEKPGPRSALGRSLSGFGGNVAAGAAGSAREFRDFAGGPSAPSSYVLSPWNFADGGPVAPETAVAHEPAGADPEMAPAHGPSPEAAGVARTVADHLSRVDPRAAAVVYADLTGLPTRFTPEDVRRAYHLLALHNAALLAQTAGGGGAAAPAAMPSGPVQRNARSRMMATMPAGRETVPLKRALGGRTPVFARDGHVPGKAEVRGDDERNDKVPAMLSPGEIVIPRTVAQSPDAPRRAASFVAHLARKRGRA